MDGSLIAQNSQKFQNSKKFSEKFPKIFFLRNTPPRFAIRELK
mgnify:CR=1 FL=1